MSALRPALWTTQVPTQPDAPSRAERPKNGPGPSRRAPSPRTAKDPRPAGEGRPGPLCFRGHQFTRLGPSECAALRDLLQQRCHPLPRLRQAAYRISRSKRFQDAPAADRAAPKRTAVVLDCEMGWPEGQSKQARELLHVTAIDFFSGEVLLDSLATPAQRIQDYRSELHGITAEALAAAARAGRALPGFGAARAELFKHIDAATVVVGHAMHNDFRVLRLRPARVVDTSILASDAVVGFGPAYPKLHGLPRLAKELLGLDMRTGPGQLHSSLEDVLVARELAIWCLRNPTELGVWATDAQRKFYMGL